MAKARTVQPTHEQLQAENERLRAENVRLQQSTTKAESAGKHWSFSARLFRKIGAIFFTALAVAVLIAGNLLFWAGNTLVKNDRYTETVAPVIQDSTVQKALAAYTTTQLYSNTDVISYIQDALPPRAQFLAPTIAGQLRGFTQTTLNKVLADPKFQDKWNQIQSQSHARFINTVKQSGGDGTIDLNELYQQLSSSLKDTKLSFLAGHQLPAKVGDIQVAKGDGIKTLHQVITHIDLWRNLAVLLFVTSGGLAIYLSRRRRRAVVRIALFSAAGLFVTLIALRITREIIAGKVMPVYADAVRRAAQIVLHPLVIQTITLLAAFLLVGFVAWVSGASRSAVYVQGRVQLLLAGKLHHAIFGEHEPAVTRWIGRYKRYLEWIVVGVIALLMLVTRLTPTTLIVYVLITVLAIVVIELLGVPDSNAEKRS